VLDKRAFSDRVVVALEQPAVAGYVAQQIAEGVVAANRDLTGVKPIIAVLARAMVESAPFRLIAARASQEAHAALFSSKAERVMLSMPDVGVMLRGALESVNPEIAGRVPVDLRLAVETRMYGVVATRALAVLRLAERVQRLARLGVLVGMLLIGLALVVTPRRRQLLLDAGIGFLAMAALLALIVPLGRLIATSAVAEPSLPPVVGALWRVFARGLLTWALGIAIVAGTVLATLAATLEPARLRAIGRRGWRALAGRQPTAVREALRLGALLAIGTFAVAEPLPTLSMAVVLAGVVLLAITVHEFLSFVAPARASSDATEAPLRTNPALAIAVVLVALVSTGLAAVAAVPRTSPAAEAAESGPVATCNGSAALCERRLDQLVFAGAHNAMGSADNPAWMFPNQDVSITRLLQKGVRALLVDVHKGHPVADQIKTDFQSEDERQKYEAVIGPEAFAAAMRIRDRLSGPGGETGLYMCHGFCELGATRFDSLLSELRTFLVQNPGEVVILDVEDYVAPAEIVAAVDRAGLTPLAYRGPWRAPFPTLAEMVELGERLIVLGEHQADSTTFYHLAYDVMQETPYTFHRPSDFSCRPNRGARTNPLFLMNHWIETTPAPKPSNAELVNTREALVSRARECRRVRGRLPNILAVDFAGIGDVVGAAAVLNGLEPMAGAPLTATR
jgi:hypothetical protein